MKTNTWLRWLSGCMLLLLMQIPQANAETQTPWQNAAGGWLMTNLNWPGYNTGFDFTPNKDGNIIKLGGLFNGTKTVRLYDANGALLAQANATANNNWGYSNISPVAVQAGQRYTVAVATGWGGSSMYYGMGFPFLPHTTGDITIERPVFGFGTSRPTNEIYGQMWGQPDVGFDTDGIIIIDPILPEPIIDDGRWWITWP